MGENEIPEAQDVEESYDPWRIHDLGSAINVFMFTFASLLSLLATFFRMKKGVAFDGK
jgi:hypothetical protein